jgi:ligand-binding SRPBCC domain-containing protein
MRIDVLHRTQRLEGTPEDVFPFFADAENLDAITPPLLRFRTETPTPIAMATGTVIQYGLRLHGVPLRWTSVIQAWEPPHRFVDVQLRGPFALWHHDHRFEATPDGGTLMTDRVHHGVGWGPAGTLARRSFVRRERRRDLRPPGAGRPGAGRGGRRTPSTGVRAGSGRGSGRGGDREGAAGDVVAAKPAAPSGVPDRQGPATAIRNATGGPPGRPSGVPDRQGPTTAIRNAIGGPPARPDLFPIGRASPRRSGTHRGTPCVPGAVPDR